MTRLAALLTLLAIGAAYYSGAFSDGLATWRERLALAEGTKSKPGAAVRADGAEKAPTVAIPQVVGFGYVEVDGGLIPLTPANPGVIKKISVSEGNQVRLGDRLIELEDDLQRAAVEEANAAVNLAEIRLKQAKKAPIRNEILAKEQAQAIEAARLRVSTLEQQLQAIDELAERRVAAGNESKAGRDRLGELKALLTAETLKLEEINLEDAELTVKLAELAVEQAKSRRRVADEQLARCVMTAPADGKILRINVRAGQIAGVNPLTPTIMFCPDGSVVCRCEIDQEFAARVETGLRAELFPDGRRDEKYVGRVSRVSSWIAPRRSTLDEPFQRNDVRTLEAIVAVDGQVDRLRIGERMRVVLFADRPIDSMIRTAGGADSRSNDRSTAVSAPRIVDNADERAAERLDDLAPVVELSETESSTSDRSGSAKSNVKPVVRAASNRPAAR